MKESKAVMEAEAEVDANRDPISGEPGAHPVGVGVGATGGAAIGGAMGTLAGPIGTVVGAAIGGLVGGLAGKTVAEGINPTAEDAYWSANYTTRPYVKAGAAYRDYQPAYRFGWEGRSRYQDLDWDAAEPRLQADWQHMGETGVNWTHASPAVRDAWERTIRERNAKI
jgi:phage tail tape-measure protein